MLQTTKDVVDVNCPIHEANAITVQKDGDKWCAFRKGFTNLQEDLAGFGDCPACAISDLGLEERNAKKKTTNNYY